jgi:lysophospholipase L1-like esterase
VGRSFDSASLLRARGLCFVLLAVVVVARSVSLGAQQGAPDAGGGAQQATLDTGSAASAAPLGEPIAIEDASGRALMAFHAALYEAEAGQGQARVVFYGASHVASDLFTGGLRQRLQGRFGEGGPGFVLPAEPWRYYRNAGIRFEQSRGFRALRIKERDPKQDIYGLAGAALDAARGKRAIGVFATRANGGLSGGFSTLELYFLKQPGGGHLRLSIDGGRPRRIATAGKRVEPGYDSIDVPDGPHRVELQTEGDGRVRIFGVALERDRPGVVLDTLGIPGTRARDHLYWDDAFYREHLARRRPNLVVLSYGTNESGDDDVPIEQYEADLRRVVQRVREVTPEASCLLIGPSDRPLRNDDGYFEARPLTEAVIDVQRRVAGEQGCGFFDLQKFMGGPMSMLRWVAAQPPYGTQDYVHFTLAGYERLASVLYDALMAGCEASARDVVTRASQAGTRSATAAHELPRAVK